MPYKECIYIHFTNTLEYDIVLPDGHSVKINSASKIRALYKEAIKTENEENKEAIIKTLYPNSKEIEKIKELFDRRLSAEADEKRKEAAKIMTLFKKEVAKKKRAAAKSAKPVKRKLAKSVQGGGYIDDYFTDS